MKYPRYRISELFSGADGVALGAKNAQNDLAHFDLAWANDINEDACKTLRRNLSTRDSSVICSKVQDLNFDELEAINGLAFGFPCNDFSSVAKCYGIEGEFGKLYQWGEKTLRHLRRLFFVAENVSGLVSSGSKEDLDHILDEFKQAGYDIHPSLYPFEKYGVSQARHRIFIAGFRKGLSVALKHPDPTHGENPVTATDALADIAKNSCNNEYTRHPRYAFERPKHIEPGENAFTATLPSKLQLQMKSGATISQDYRRLRPDQPSYTVVGSGEGGNHRDAELPPHPIKPRHHYGMNKGSINSASRLAYHANARYIHRPSRRSGNKSHHHP